MGLKEIQDRLKQVENAIRLGAAVRAASDAKTAAWLKGIADRLRELAG